jgi:hypothetical protein
MKQAENVLGHFERLDRLVEKVVDARRLTARSDGGNCAGSRLVFVVPLFRGRGNFFLRRRRETRLVAADDTNQTGRMPSIEHAQADAVFFDGLMAQSTSFGRDKVLIERPTQRGFFGDLRLEVSCDATQPVVEVGD